MRDPGRMRNSAVIVSYNTHGAIGIDRRFAPERIARVLAEIDADIVALQEIELRTRFDTLRDDGQMERARHRDDRVGDRYVA